MQQEDKVRSIEAVQRLGEVQVLAWEKSEA
jgi:hypothetical protein